jgi:protein phosphatase
MGGRAAGETASKAVITVLPIMLKDSLDALDHPTPGSITYVLGRALGDLSQNLYRQSQEIPEIRGLGSTAALVFIRDDMAYIACAGDSRVYLWRKGQLIQISKDQTVAAALVRTGHLSPDKVDSHPLSHALEEYIGKEGNLHPGVWCKKIQTGDRWLLCSDGLTKGITDQKLSDLLSEELPSETICERLVSQAKNTDGTDNITAIVIDVIEQNSRL